MTLPTTVSPADAPARDRDTALERMRRLRAESVAEYRPLVANEPAPIRVQARMVSTLVAAAHQAGIPQDIIEHEVVNRTIGDVNVRLITEVVDGVDYSTIGEDLGIILPGERINGRVSTGQTYLDVRERMMHFERLLLEEYHWDMRIYDIYAVGNPVLRDRLATRFQREYGVPLKRDQVFICAGALDGMDKSLRTLNLYFREKYQHQVGFAFPAPGFAVCLWQAASYGMDVINFPTPEADRFKLTPTTLTRLLADHPNLHVLYLTVSNNPTAFAYSPDEIRALYAVLRDSGREVAVLADLAYIGTGDPAADRARMVPFAEPDIAGRTIFISSLSKVFTLTGDRMGWVGVTNPAWAKVLPAAWNNANAGLPAEWQLRYLAMIDLVDERPWIQDKIRALYALRRQALRYELEQFNSQFGVFETIGLDDDTTIYNWSKLSASEDAFSLFEKTGVAGVDGRGFGYSPQYIRFSVGFTPVPPALIRRLRSA